MASDGEDSPPPESKIIKAATKVTSAVGNEARAISSAVTPGLKKMGEKAKSSINTKKAKALEKISAAEAAQKARTAKSIEASKAIKERRAARAAKQANLEQIKPRKKRKGPITYTQSILESPLSEAYTGIRIKQDGGGRRKTRKRVKKQRYTRRR